MFFLDDNIFYHCGASINRIGHKTFSINLISDNEIGNMLLNRINNIKDWIIFLVFLIKI